jgi:hypothetical protein
MPKVLRITTSDNADPVLALVDAWRNEAATLRDRYADHRLATSVETHARELHEAMQHRANIELTLQDAATESGYSVAHIRHLIACGELQNVGKRGRPRVRRGALPSKPNKKRVRPSATQPRSGFDVSAIIADAVRRRGA